MNAPCKDCEKRHPNCHAHCEEYQAFAAWNAKRLEETRRESDFYGYKKDSVIRVLKKTKWRR